MGRQLYISTYSSSNNEPVVCNSLSVRLRYTQVERKLTCHQLHTDSPPSKYTQTSADGRDYRCAAYHR
jgi:hypothetical protein